MGTKDQVKKQIADALYDVIRKAYKDASLRRNTRYSFRSPKRTK